MHFRPLPVLTVSTSIAFVILIALGLWQLERREEKHALLREMAQRMIAPAESIEELAVNQSAAPLRLAATSCRPNRLSGCRSTHPRGRSVTRRHRAPSSISRKPTFTRRSEKTAAR